jgi:glucosamine-phosphate N-acetyltransferase
MKIRQLQSSDIKQVIDLWTSSFSRTFDNPVNNNYLNDPNSITFVMSDNKAILGVASLHIIEKLTRKLGLIEDVAVSKNNRGLGIGKKLVEKLIQTGIEKKCDKIVLSSSEKNSEFYEKMGFQKKELSMVIRN